MGEIKSSGSSRVFVPSDAVAGVFGPWTALFMGVDQATHGLTFDSSWALLVIHIDTFIGGQNIGVRYDVEIGVGPASPPGEIVWGPMRFATVHTGGGRGDACNYSFPLELKAGDQLWCRCKKDDTTVVDELAVFLTVSDQVRPARAASVHFSTKEIFAPATPTGVLFPGSNILGSWYIMGQDGTGAGTPLEFNTSWLSLTIILLGIGTTGGRWQLGASRDGNPPDLPELIDVGFQSFGGGGSHVSVVGDVLNFPIPWEKGDTVWIRGAVFPIVASRTFKVAANFWGNP